MTKPGDIVDKVSGQSKEIGGDIEDTRKAAYDKAGDIVDKVETRPRKSAAISWTAGKSVLKKSGGSSTMRNRRSRTGGMTASHPPRHAALPRGDVAVQAEEGG